MIPHILPIRSFREQERGSRVTITLVESLDRAHILLAQLEVEDTAVLKNAILMNGLGNANGATLHSPTNHDLSRSLVILVSNALDHRILHRTRDAHRTSVRSAAQREVSHQVHAILIADLLRLPLLEIRMKLNLVHSGLYSTEGKDVANALSGEVGNTNGADESSTAQLLHPAPRLLHILNRVTKTAVLLLEEERAVEEVSLSSLLVHLLREVDEATLVNQKQIDVVHLEFFQAEFHRSFNVLRLPFGDPQLRGNEDVLSLHDSLLNASLDRSANSLLIRVSNSRINETITVLDSSIDSTLTVLLRRKEGSMDEIEECAENPRPRRGIMYPEFSFTEESICSIVKKE